MFLNGNSNFPSAIFVAFTVIQFEFPIVTGLRINELIIPQPMLPGETVEFVCDFELDKDVDQLHTIRWLRNGLEFFRYVHTANPPVTYFPQDTIDVDLSKSFYNSVTLRNVSLAIDGLYRCEVTTTDRGDQGGSDTQHTERLVTVFHFPGQPMIMGPVKSVYKVNDAVNFTCASTGKGSHPKGVIRWHINGIPVVSGPNYTITNQVYSPEHSSISLPRVSSTIWFRLTEHHLTTTTNSANHGALLSCEFQLYPVYRAVSHVMLAGETTVDVPSRQHTTIIIQKNRRFVTRGSQLSKQQPQSNTGNKVLRLLFSVLSHVMFSGL